jgi:transcription elongation factor GreA
MAEKYPMTPRCQRRMKEELKRLKEVERPANVLAIEEARAHGDLSENAEFSAAKEQQSHIAGRITDLETKLALAEVIDPATMSGTRVVFGATVTTRPPTPSSATTRPTSSRP